jgi:hypothetical protein
MAINISSETMDDLRNALKLYVERSRAFQAQVHDAVETDVILTPLRLKQISAGMAEVKAAEDSYDQKIRAAGL